jgi:intracellular multiplication protein IcmO
MSIGSIYGVDVNEDLDPALISRDTRPFRYHFNSFMKNNSGISIVLLGFLTFAIPFFNVPQISDLLALTGVIIYLIARKKRKSYDYETPMQMDSKGRMQGTGFIFFGNDRQSNAGIWMGETVTTHGLCMGSTGSGKTRFLLGILYQALLAGSGCMYVDGKGDNTVWWLFISICRRLDRLDDVLVMNYLIGEDTGETGHIREENRLSNTNNLLAYGSAEQLRSLIMGLMRGSGGGDGDMWKGRASAMLGGLLKALVCMRNRGEIELDIGAVRSWMPLDKVIEISKRKDLPKSAIAPIKSFLMELPGYNEVDAVMNRISSKAYEQHTYLTMQISEIMGDLSETYGHIFNVRKGEIDFKDLVFNRRCLFVMLPALEKDPDALAGLGKLVVSGIRAALGPALGNKLNGNKKEVIDQKPTNGKVPFILILDEYGYYSVPGFAVVAAQARSLMVSVIFAGQDYPSFKRGGEEEAASTSANTNFKICFKLEDPKETFDLFEARGGAANITVTSGHEVSTGALSGYVDQNQTRVESKKRINLRDLVSQKAGQGHIIFGDKISRFNAFYADPELLTDARINHFVQVLDPSLATIKSLKGTFDKLNEIFESPKTGDLPVTQDHGIKHIFSDFKLALDHSEDMTNSAMTAIGLMEFREAIKDKDLKELAGIEEDNAAPETIYESPDKEIEQAADDILNDDYDIPEELITGTTEDSYSDLPTELNEEDAPEMPMEEEITASKTKSTEEVIKKTYEDDRAEILTGDNETDLNGTVSEEAKKISSKFERLLTNVVVATAQRNSGVPLKKSEIAEINPVSQLSKIGVMLGETESDSIEMAKKEMKIISERIIYPKGDTPEKESKEDLLLKFKKMAALVNKNNIQ